MCNVLPPTEYPGGGVYFNISAITPFSCMEFFVVEKLYYFKTVTNLDDCQSSDIL